MVGAYGGYFNFQETDWRDEGLFWVPLHAMLNTAIANYKAIALRIRLVTSSTVRLWKMLVR